MCRRATQHKLKSFGRFCASKATEIDNDITEIGINFFMFYLLELMMTQNYFDMLPGIITSIMSKMTIII
jgi:hypothetical protein